jgi:hypothetical protein
MNDLLAKLANVAVHAAVDDDSPWIELSRCQSVSAAKLTDVLERALIGRLQLIEKGSDHRGLRRFSFNRDDLVRQFPLLPHGYVSVTEAARYPHLTKQYLWTSLRSGLLPSVKHPRKGRMVDITAVATFRAEYVNSDELEEIYGITRNRVSVELVDSAAAFVMSASKVRVWYRRRALEILDRKFHRTEKRAV